MSARGSQSRSVSLLGYEVSPKQVQPRLVLLLLVSASFAGIWVSHWDAPLTARALWWVLLVGNGLLAGGLYWRVVLYDAAALEDADARELVRSRWAVLEAAAVWTVALCGISILAVGAPVSADDTGTLLLSGGFVLAPLLWAGVAWGGEHTAPRLTAACRVALLAASVVTLGAFAWVETGTTAGDWLVRVGHVGAFALWLGGAVWHNGIVLPTIQRRPAAEATIKAQAKRFRKHLFAVVPVLFLTGGYQIVGLFGPDPALLYETPIGHVVLAKVLVLTVLTAIVVAHLKKARAS